MTGEVSDAGLLRVHHVFLFLVLAIVVAFGLWAWYGQLDVVSIAVGRVVPSGKVKTVQHLEGGIVRDILVKEGDHVQQGQPLVVLEKTSSAIDVEAIRSAIAGFSVDIARLEAQSQGKDKVTFPEGFEEKYPRLVEEARNIFQSRRRQLKSTLSGLDEEIFQRSRDITSAEQQITNGAESLELLQKQLDLSKELLAENLTTKYKHLQLELDVKKTQGRLAESRQTLKRARSALAQAEQKRGQVEQTFVAEATMALKVAREKRKERTISLGRYEDNLKRTELRSPVDGIVKTVYIVTRGGVVKPGMPIMDIVPVDDRLIVQALLAIEDIGYVRIGQEVDVRLASRDARRFGKIEGRIISISPDAVTGDKGQSFYPINVRTENNAFVNGANTYRLYPGMQVLVSIHLGSRSVLSFFLDRFMTTATFTFQQR